jgi:hypothetical protein
MSHHTFRPAFERSNCVVLGQPTLRGQFVTKSKCFGFESLQSRIVRVKVSQCLNEGWTIYQGVINQSSRWVFIYSYWKLANLTYLNCTCVHECTVQMYILYLAARRVEWAAGSGILVAFFVLCTQLSHCMYTNQANSSVYDYNNNNLVLWDWLHVPSRWVMEALFPTHTCPP